MTIPSRVTDTSMKSRMLGDLNRAMARGQKLQEQISSGKQLSRPSDSPTGTVSSLQLRGEMRATQQYARNADDGLGWLGTIQDKLGAASGQIIRVRDLTLQGLSSANNDSARAALAVEIENIRDSLVSEANAKYMGRPVFGGTTPGGVAFEAANADDVANGRAVAVGDIVYRGNEGTTSRTVGANAKVRIEANGKEAFGDGDTQLFKVLDDISKALRGNNDADLDEALGNLDTAHDLLKSTLSDVGARYNRITQMKQSADDHLLSVTSQLSDIEDVDLPKAIMELQIQQTSYQAALAASAKVIQPSLIDFLR
ncbi:flagellin N-terminal helical domain-containing protein [Paractinoplanes brasiliensis]|uniref:Flagellin n=1 Tax=Paractinoplanes brasiliensis TaxID=52695 RepID=A0A4V3C895_9ACTN|nr:flagellin [Actinoplanes brasiliensis]TDO40038.1 flagellar hook-associated protein 3 FlgL [Actinoplanes brasiliensis]GID25103.1 flagellar hook-associated protein FlgL [Actinoplanes brasiliensis]